MVNKKNGGHGSTINKGLEIANGKYVKVIDGDDWVDTTNFILFVDRLKFCDEDVVLNSFNRVNIDTGEVTCKKLDNLDQDKTYRMEDIIYDIRDEYAMHGCTFKTDVIRNMKKLDENCFYVDQEFLLYPLARIKTVRYYDIPVYQYRVGNNEQSMSLKSMQKNRNMHKRVIFSLLDLLPINNQKVAAFIEYRIKKMSQLQIDIYFSMEKGDDVKSELLGFLNDLNKKNKKIYHAIPGKKIKILRVLKGIGYDLVCGIKG